MLEVSLSSIFGSSPAKTKLPHHGGMVSRPRRSQSTSKWHATVHNRGLWCWMLTEWYRLKVTLKQHINVQRQYVQAQPPWKRQETAKNPRNRSLRHHLEFGEPGRARFLGPKPQGKTSLAHWIHMGFFSFLFKSNRCFGCSSSFELICVFYLFSIYGLIVVIELQRESLKN